MLTSESDTENTVLDIMLSVGFQNKATFNSLFKKMEGMTPTEYKKQHTKEQQKAAALITFFLSVVKLIYLNTIHT